MEGNRDDEDKNTGNEAWWIALDTPLQHTPPELLSVPQLISCVQIMSVQLVDDKKLPIGIIFQLTRIIDHMDGVYYKLLIHKLVTCIN